MKVYKSLDIKGATLDRYQLESYLKKIASEHVVKNSSDKNTYPIPNMKENFNIITETYRLLNKHIKLGIPIHAAGEWLLDNYYIIEENYKTIEKEMTLKKYKKLIGLSTGRYKGFARIYVLASEIVAYTDGKIDSETIELAISTYQEKKLLSMEEIWNIGVFLKIAIIQNIKDVCEKIYASQMQKVKVESMMERLIERKSKNEQVFNVNSKIKSISYRELKYPFIEYMSYRLKKYGKQAITYQNILEEQVYKMGLTVSEVIAREHFYIATLKLTIGNCIKSIKEINRINFGELFNTISGTEEILRNDPADVYSKMTQDSKMYYRKIIEEMSKKTKISEIYIAEKALNLALEYKDATDLEERKKSHIGYYLIDNGKNKLWEVLTGNQSKILTATQKSKIYMSSFFAFSFLGSFALSTFIYAKTLNIWLYIVSFLILLVPISEIYIQIVNYILGKIVKPKTIPKIDYEKGVTPENSTFIVIPTILKSKEKVKEYIKKLEVYYLANKSDNLYFALLGDCTMSDKKDEPYDEEIIQTGLEEIKKLNEKYKNENFPLFHFLYRERLWNSGESAYIGWERKRGLLFSFNEYLKGKIENNFKCNTIEIYKDKMPNIKYVITLDADTSLVLNSAFELIGAMSHILNLPVIDEKTNTVVDGYGIMQPRVGIDLNTYSRSLFVQLFAMQGGVDSYTNAIFDVYQDNFSEGIFAGKGIYDVSIYNRVLEKEIPENTVLSHDLLEGSFLRCGLLSDVMLLDGYPTKYSAYMLRNHRWIRGDWQIIKWLKSNRLNELSKFKIFDNLRRSIVNLLGFICFIFGLLLIQFNKELGILTVIIGSSSIVISNIIDVLNYIIFKESNVEGAVYAHKKFSGEVSGVKASIIRGILVISFLPYEIKNNIDAIIKSLYRMRKKKKLLEWTTSEDAEKMLKTDLFSYLNLMKINIVLGILIILFAICIGINGLLSNCVILNSLMIIVGILWCISPILAYYVSKENTEKITVSDDDKNYVLEIGRKIWKFFDDNITKENNYLIPDNYQEDRKEKLVNRTSSTNIGLELLAIISAYDLGYISIEKAEELIINVVNIIKILSKWNGHLYNWYNIKTLEPLRPQYVSTVDSGNFVGYLYVLKQFLIENNLNQNIINDVDYLINETDFSKLYSTKNRLFSIGFSLEENKLTDSYYDFLASEARQASFIAIAKKDVPAKHWNNLSRTLTTLKQYKGLISWSGTAFEYLMPNINIKRYKGSLLDEASKFLILSQIEYSKKLGIPWGISESAFNLKDLNSNYQYKAFGIPWLGLKRGLADDMVISPYSTFLSMMDVPKHAINNLRLLEKEGLYDKYGFYESIDYTPSRLKTDEVSSVVKTYMAHHQGLSLLSINNFLKDNILQKRFYNNPEIEAIDILLQERMPAKMIITKEKKEKIEKPKIVSDGNYIERVYQKTGTLPINIDFLSNDNYQICIDENGEGYSKYKNKLVTSYKETSELNQGVFFYIKNTRTKKIWQGYGSQKIIFAPDKAKFTRIDGNLETSTSITIDAKSSTEIRRLEVKNNGNNEEILEITSSFEPILSSESQDYAHPAFNKLFLKFDYQDDNIIVERKNRGSGKKIYLATTLYTESECIGDLEYEIDKEKFLGRENILVPIEVQESKTFSKALGTVVDSIVAMKRIVKVMPGDKIALNLIISVSEDKEEAKENLESLKHEGEISKTFELSRTRAEEELKYLGVSGKMQALYQEVLGYILFMNPLKSVQYKNIKIKKYEMDSLWKFGISGDDPIILAKVRNIEDMYLVEELLSMFEYYKAKNIKIDLVILNEEKNVYEQYVKEGIISSILNRQLDYMKNNGIYLINSNEVEPQDLDCIELNSKIVFDAKKGGVKNIIHDLEERYLDTKKHIGDIEYKEKNLEKIIINENKDELLYNNSYGGFSSDGKEYLITVNRDKKLPTVWSNIISNDKFGSLVTENMGGFVWSENSRLNRITSWINKATENIPSEIIYIKNFNTNETWTLNSSIDANSNNYDVKYGFGYAEYKNLYNGLFITSEVFVPLENKIKITKINIKNTEHEEKNLKLIYYLKPVLGEDEIKTNGKLLVKKDGNLVTVENLVKDEFNNICYVSSSENILSYTGNKDSFLGSGNIIVPEAINKVSLDNESNIGQNSCVAIEINVTIKSYENKVISLLLGKENNVLEAKNTAYKYSNILNCDEELRNVKKFWNDKTSIIKVKTPIDSINIMLNGWAIYQTIVCRLLARSAYYQSGGAIGYRDQLQDTLGMKYIDINLMKNQIIKAAHHQFKEGDVEHWWHEETKKGIRTRFSDDLLWLVYTVCEYIDYTDDYSILNIESEYLEGDALKPGEDERYDSYKPGNVKENIYKHCIRAIDRMSNFGENGFPKIGSGDWNDGFSTVGNKGRGESVWLAFFLYDILTKFIPICERMCDEVSVKKYAEIRENLKKTLNTNGWDGRWYKRAITDSGDVLGSIENEECRIDSISQSWSVISNAGDNDKKYISMESAEMHLVDKENGLIKLLDPAFEKSKLEPGYIKAYPAGIRENGGQYTHAAIWFILAETLLGFGDKAVEYYKMITPIEHSKTKDLAKKYKIEPYVLPGDVYTATNLEGRGGWSWYTGSSSWYYKIGIENILGLKIKKGILKIEPCIAKEWKEYEIQYRYIDTIYNIIVRNPESKQTGVSKFIYNDQEIAEKEIKLQNNGKINKIEIIM